MIQYHVLLLHSYLIKRTIHNLQYNIVNTHSKDHLYLMSNLVKPAIDLTIASGDIKVIDDVLSMFTIEL